jgi:eukaryotic-like serine/threonine-protein kinase
MAKADPDLGGPLRYRVEQRNGATWVALSGHVNEATNFAPLKKVANRLVFDLGGIDRINSIGVRRWMDFVRDCEVAGFELTFERCSPVLVGQMSMIRRFMGSRSFVKSIVVPYFCPSCKHEDDTVLELAPGAAVAPQIACPKCKAAMQLDEVPETYVEVLQHV